mmetsp:Transcript_2320/g.3069  ORF Transcript_2320/g.3069 Transcript_2320/m.3069 type:complete len:274 (+) Transcript_2320:52-873(+)
MADPTNSTPGGKQQQRVSISTVAHAKMILHAVCKATQQVHGILIGRFAETDAGASAAPTLFIEDALPVCHEAPTKPIVDTSLRLAETYCDSLSEEKSDDSNQCRVVGWYTANERLGGDENVRPGQAALRIAGSIGARLLSEAADKPLPAHAEPVLILIGNGALAELLGAENGCDASALPNAVNVFGRDQRKHWLRRFPADCVISNDSIKEKKSFQSSIEAVRSAVSSSTDLVKVPLYDFVDHMEGGTGATGERDWLINSNVKKMVQDSMFKSH